MLSSLRRKEGSHHQGLLRVVKNWWWWTKWWWWTFYWWKLSQPIPSSRANPKLSSLKWSVWTKSLMPSIPPSSSSGTNIMCTWATTLKWKDENVIRAMMCIYVKDLNRSLKSSPFLLYPSHSLQMLNLEQKIWLNHLKLTQLQTIMVILQIPQRSSCPGFHEPRFFPPGPCAPQTGGGSNIQGRLEPATYCPNV